MDKDNWSLFKGIPKNVPSATSSDAKWGATSLGVSVVFFLLPTALAFWSIQISLDGGKIMLPSSVGAWVFFVFALLCFFGALALGIFTWRMAWRWYAKSGNVKSESQELLELKNHLDNHIDIKIGELSEKIGELSEQVMTLINELRQERNERNNEPKS